MPQMLAYTIAQSIVAAQGGQGEGLLNLLKKGD